MAKNDNPASAKKIETMNNDLRDILKGENTALYGGESNRAEELMRVHNRYNELIQKDYQGMRSSKDPSDSTYDYITNAILGKKDRNIDGSKKNPFTTGNKTQDELLKNAQLDRLFTMGDTQVANYFLSTSTDLCHIYDEIDSVCSYFYQLDEAVNVIRDNVLRAEQVNEDISINVNFPGITEDTSEYVSIVKKALDYQNVGVKIRDHVAIKGIKYGLYYMMVIPYKEIGSKLMSLNMNMHGGNCGYAFYESTDTHALFGDKNFDSCMENVTTLFESFEENKEDNHLTPEMSKKLNIIKENLKNIYVCEDTSIPDIEGLGTHKKISHHITDAITKAMEKNTKELDPSVQSMKPSKIKVSVNNTFESNPPKDIKKDMEMFKDRELGSIGNNKTFNEIADEYQKNGNKDTNKKMSTTFMGNAYNISPEDLKNSEDMLGCHIKLIDPRTMFPIKIFDYTIGYYYFENYDYTRLNTSVTDIMSNQMNFDNRTTIIDEIVDSVLKNLEYGDILKGDNQLRSMILNCVLYAEKRDNPIRIKFVRPDYVIPWKTNLDEHDNGRPVLLRSLLYARLYTSLMLFYTTAIITKSTDSEFYYLKESALDSQNNNQISDLMDQLEDSNIDPIQIANGNILHGNRAINKRFYMNMGTSEIKPFEMDVVSGSNFDIHSDFMESLKKMAIGATSVSSVMIDAVDEVEYATMLGMMNIKHLIRCNGIKKDYNTPLTQVVKLIIQFCFPNAIPPNVLDKMQIVLRESKIIENNIKGQELQDIASVAELMTNTWVGGDNTNPPEYTAFIKEDIQRQLVIAQTPSAPWELMDGFYTTAILNARKNQLYNKTLGKQSEE